MDPRAYYDTFSQSYDHGRHEGYHALVDDLEIELAMPFAKGASVLEAGCGTGRILSRLAPHAREAVGADLSGGMLAGAVRRGLNVVQADLTALPFADASFDFVCSFKVLAHVPPIEEALRELVRVTRPGGTLVLEFYNQLSLRTLTKRLKPPTRIRGDVHDEHVFTRFDTPRSIERALPSNVRVERYAGIRVITPFAGALRVPVVGGLLERAERAAMRSPLRWLGGFLVAVVRRES
jgi:ubiquinone/menaquinone biosynthesis C-methylase UbiE